MDITKSRKGNLFLEHEERVVLSDINEKPYRITPFMITFCEGVLTHIDMQNLIELGMHMVRFRMRKVTRDDKLKLLSMLHKAVRWVCEKYDVSDWPVALCLDIPNTLIRTGYLDESIKDSKIIYLNGSIIDLTCNVELMNKCSTDLMYIDDPYSIAEIKTGTEVSVSCGQVVMICTEVVDKQNVKCMITRGGIVGNHEYVCVRGIKFNRPPLSERDMEHIVFAKDYKFDYITFHGVRRAMTLKLARALFVSEMLPPLILGSICEQEGLDNIDAIIEEADGIILSREFLADQIVNKNKMTAIQLQVSAKCRRAGKPFFLSGNILDDTLLAGTISPLDLSDITNAIMQGAGFLLKDFYEPANLVKTMKVLNSVCKSVEAMAIDNDFWRMCMEFKMPVTAADACVLACALAIRQSGAVCVIVPTVTGRTAIQLSRIAPEAIIITISTNSAVARKLQFYRGIIPVVYSKKVKDDWYDDMTVRIQFAVSYGIKQEILKYGNTYVTLRKSRPYSAFCDHIGLWQVISSETEKHRVKCSFESTDPTKQMYESNIQMLTSSIYL